MKINYFMFLLFLATFYKACQIYLGILNLLLKIFRLTLRLYKLFLFVFPQAFSQFKIFCHPNWFYHAQIPNRQFHKELYFQLLLFIILPLPYHIRLEFRPILEFVLFHRFVILSELPN